MPPYAEERVAIGGPAGKIDAVACGAQVGAAAYAVVCHPHPQFGGTMHNKVVTTLARALRECAIATVRFNFRGVGGSEGHFNDGIGETADASAVADWGERRWAGRPLVIAGFSFGALVALRLAQRRDPQRVILIAPPVAHLEFAALSVPRCPWMVVQGDADTVVDPLAVSTWAQAAAPAPRLLMLPGVGHFFHGHLPELRDAVVNEIRSA